MESEEKLSLDSLTKLEPTKRILLLSVAALEVAEESLVESADQVQIYEILETSRGPVAEWTKVGASADAKLPTTKGLR